MALYKDGDSVQILTKLRDEDKYICMELRDIEVDINTCSNVKREPPPLTE